MNNHPLLNKSSKLPDRPVNALFLSFCLFIAMSVLSSADAFAQTTKWRYVMTVPDGAKSYLNDEVKTLRNSNKLAWEKIITPTGSSMVALTLWDCPNRLRLMRQITRYSSDGRTSETGKPSPRWDEIIPDSMSDLHYARICLPAPPVKWARISAPQTPLRQLPGSDSPIIRIAASGERFEIVPESEKRNWVNVVDPATQQDYWLLYKWFETIEEEQPLRKRNPTAAAAKAAPTVIKSKAQKANAQTVKTGKGRKRVNR